MQPVLYQWYWTTIDWLFPPTCGGCNMLGVRWCSNCQITTKQIKAPYCQQCGVHISSSGLCARCKEFISNVAAVRSWAVFGGPIRQAIHPYKNKALKRVVDTRSQVGLSLMERRDNVADVFKASPIAANKSILVVDDVATSGATLESCAGALKIAGAKVVYGMTLTRAVFSP